MSDSGTSDVFPASVRQKNRLRRDDSIQTESLSICGYHNGDPNLGRKAPPGFNCRVDAKAGYWGYCPNTVTAVSDCNIPRSCSDDHCSDGCGESGASNVLTCMGTKPFCFVDLLVAGPDQSYTNYQCHTVAGRATYFAALTVTPPSTVSTSPAAPQITPSITEPSSTAQSSVPTSTVVAEPTKSSSRIGAIIGGSVGCIGLICISIVIIFYLRRRAPKPSRKADSDAATETQILEQPEEMLPEQNFGELEQPPVELSQYDYVPELEGHSISSARNSK
ncbi:hypothetical protein K469DRAFT_700208 [Zopfia rhizophila CBS 207.26]|uniref:Uncharacterized protein n=1 Tax=Zopfia rhizophila CBS 207.26 TaxID=1314779 RepID=A0A6A6D9U5_9PEZI|nr:hypothetical protein K469DRAFT_700208 [Zopfia rhizophila CBS 207.26]